MTLDQMVYLIKYVTESPIMRDGISHHDADKIIAALRAGQQMRDAIKITSAQMDGKHKYWPEQPERFNKAVHAWDAATNDEEKSTFQEQVAETLKAMARVAKEL